MRTLAFGLLAFGDDVGVNDDQRSGSSTSIQILDRLAAGTVAPLPELMSDPVAPDETPPPPSPMLDPPATEEPVVIASPDPVPVDSTPPLEEAPTVPAPTLTPVFAAGLNDPKSISASQILVDRPDVLRAYYQEFYSHDEGHARGWSAKIGGSSPEAYASYWYKHYGKYEGYAQGATTAQDNVDLQKILTDRPDVLKEFYKEFYGANEGKHASGWVDRIGGDTPEAFAKYWYEKHGKWEGYAQSEKQAAENVDVERILTDRPDVMRGFYEGFYGPNNDRHSHAWADRVGGETVQDYAKYWYTTHGKAEGYTQAKAAQSSPAPVTEDGRTAPDTGGESPPLTTDAESPAGVVIDPSLDPWNHPAIYPNWTPPYPGWVAPDANSAVPSVSAASIPEPPPAMDLVEVGHVSMADMISVGQSLGGPDLFG